MRMRYQEALARALHDEMESDDSVFVIGEDVRQSLRGVTRGLTAEFGESRVLDAPLSEQAFTSFASGAALNGRRPFVEYQIPALLYIAFEQIVNQAHKFRLMTGGQAAVPVTYFVPGSGARNGLAGQHSDNPYAFFAHAGVTTVVPGDAQDAYSLTRAAIRLDDPVVLVAPAAVLGERGEVDTGVVGRIGEAKVKREGAQVTLIATGHLLSLALRVAELLGDEISVEVVDVRTVFPLDRATLVESARKTGRVVVLDDTNRSVGFAAEVLSSIVTEVRLAARPVRVTREDVVIPFAPELERVLLPSEEKTVDAIRAVMQEGNN